MTKEQFMLEYMLRRATSPGTTENDAKVAENAWNEIPKRLPKRVYAD